MSRNYHDSAFSAALAEVKNLKQQGVTDCDTLINAGIIGYSAAILSLVENKHEDLKKQALNANRMLGFSMVLNVFFVAIIVLTAIFCWVKYVA